LAYFIAGNIVGHSPGRDQPTLPTLHFTTAQETEIELHTGEVESAFSSQRSHHHDVDLQDIISIE
jgi:hypothetical protein